MFVIIIILAELLFYFLQWAEKTFRKNCLCSKLLPLFRTTWTASKKIRKLSEGLEFQRPTEAIRIFLPNYCVLFSIQFLKAFVGSSFVKTSFDCFYFQVYWALRPLYSIKHIFTSIKWTHENSKKGIVAPFR